MNTELVEAALAAYGHRLVVPDDGEVIDNLVRDMIEMLTWFCAGRETLWTFSVAIALKG